MDVYARRRLVAGLVAVGALVVIIVAIASAGGDDDDVAPVEGVNGGDEGAVSKSEFIQEADAVCAEANAAVANLSVGPAADDPELLAEQQYEYTRSELEQLQTLTPPEEDRSALNRFYTALRDKIDVLNKQQVAIQRADDTALADVSTELPAAQAEVRAAAAGYGFKECGREGAPATDVDAEVAPTDVAEAPAVAPETPVETAPAAPVETPPAEALPAPAPTDTVVTPEPPADTGGGTAEPPATEPPGSGGTAPGDSGGVTP
jgi:hypothetical protein